MSTDQDHVIRHVRCRPDTTADGHRRVLDLLGDFTPAVQPLPPLAVLAQLRGAGRLFQAAPGRLAARFRIQALAKYGVDTHIGIADTWATAATASAHPGRSGILHLPDHRAVEQFLAPLPVRALHGIGPAQAALMPISSFGSGRSSVKSQFRSCVRERPTRTHTPPARRADRLPGHRPGLRPGPSLRRAPPIPTRIPAARVDPPGRAGRPEAGERLRRLPPTGPCRRYCRAHPPLELRHR